MAKMGEIVDYAALADEIEAELEDASRAVGTYADDPSGWHSRHRLEMDRLIGRLAASHGARIDETKSWISTRVRIAGISSSSTTGISGAIRNWIVAARKKATSS